MRVAIITIGDEILYGQTIDTNSAWIGEQCSLLGLEMVEIASVGDDTNAIQIALKRLLERCDMIFITGGLGPTNDDLTKLTLAKYFKTGFKTDYQVLSDVEERFRNRGISMLDSNRMQAEIPEIAEAIRNPKGTAPGLWFELNGKVVVSMPGVPYEMKFMMANEVFPRIKQKFKLPLIMHKYLHTAGVGESVIAEKLKEIEKELPDDLKLAYLPGLGTVKLRLTARGFEKVGLEQKIKLFSMKIKDKLHKHLSGEDDDTIDSVIHRLFVGKNLTLSTAESCTGGLISSYLIRLPGASAFFKGGFVAYDNFLKNKLLSVSEEVLEHFGAVSEEVVCEMAKSARDLTNSDYSIAVSGIAGPDGGTTEKPVGTVWLAIAGSEEIFTKKLNLPGDRRQNIRLTAIIALNELRKFVTAQLDK